MFDFHEERHRAAAGHDANQFGGFGQQQSQPWRGFGMNPASPFGEQQQQPSFDIQGRSFSTSSGMDWSSNAGDQHMDFQQGSFVDSLAGDHTMDLIQLDPIQPDNGGVGRLVAQFENKDYVPPLPPRAIQQQNTSNDIQMGNSSSDHSSYFGGFNGNGNPERVASPLVSPGGESHFGSFQSRIASPLSTTPGSMPFGSFQDANQLSSPIDGPSPGGFGQLDNFMSSYQSQPTPQPFRTPSFSQQMGSQPMNNSMSNHSMGQMVPSQPPTLQRTQSSNVGTPGFSMWRPPVPNTPKPSLPISNMPSNSNNFFKPPVPTTPKPTIGSQFILEFNPTSSAKPKAPPKPPRPRMAPPPLPPKVSIKEEASTPQLIDVSTDPAEQEDVSGNRKDQKRYRILIKA